MASTCWQWFIIIYIGGRVEESCILVFATFFIFIILVLVDSVQLVNILSLMHIRQSILKMAISYENVQLGLKFLVGRVSPYFFLSSNTQPLSLTSSYRSASSPTHLCAHRGIQTSTVTDTFNKCHYFLMLISVLWRDSALNASFRTYR